MLRSLIVTAALTLSATVAHADPWQSDEKFRIGEWSGEARRDLGDKDGYGFCEIHAKYVSGTTVTFSVNYDNFMFVLGLSNLSWAIKTGEVYRGALWVDNADPFAIEFKAISPTLVMFKPPRQPEVFRQMRLGKTLHVKTAQQTLDFNLTATNTALGRLYQCAKAHSRSSATNPFEGDANPFAGQAPNAEAARPKRGMTLATGTAMLIGEVGAHTIERSEYPAVLATSQHRWTKGNVFGGADDTTSTDLDGIAAEQKAAHERECRGRADVSTDYMRFSPDKSVRRLAVFCSATGVLTRYIFMTDKTNSRITKIVHLGPPAEVTSIDEALLRLLRQIATQAPERKKVNPF